MENKNSNKNVVYLTQMLYICIVLNLFSMT